MPLYFQSQIVTGRRIEDDTLQELIITDLESDTNYTFTIKCRPLGEDNTERGFWSDAVQSVSTKTYPSGRFSAFLLNVVSITHKFSSADVKNTTEFTSSKGLTCNPTEYK
jgi:hypothetical protein